MRRLFEGGIYLEAASIRVNTVLIKIFSRQVQRLFEGGVNLNVGRYQELYLLQYYYFPC